MRRVAISGTFLLQKLEVTFLSKMGILKFCLNQAAYMGLRKPSGGYWNTALVAFGGAR